MFFFVCVILIVVIFLLVLVIKYQRDYFMVLLAISLMRTINEDYQIFDYLESFLRLKKTRRLTYQGQKEMLDQLLKEEFIFLYKFKDKIFKGDKKNLDKIYKQVKKEQNIKEEGNVDILIKCFITMGYWQCYNYYVDNFNDISNPKKRHVPKLTLGQSTLKGMFKKNMEFLN